MTRMVSKTLSAFVVALGIAGFASTAFAVCDYGGHKSVTDTDDTIIQKPITEVPKTQEGDAT